MPSLRVAAERTDLEVVVTQPDRPAGRGHRLAPTPVKRAAMELGLPVETPERLRDFAAQRAGKPCDLILLASYGRILPQAVLDMPRLGAFNVHPSLLPQYRGATPIQSALRNGDMETGVTIMLMDAGMDTGEVVLQERTPIAFAESYGELHDRLARFGAQALAHAIDLAKSGHVPHHPQAGVPSVTRPIRKEDLTIDWSTPADAVVNHVRAYAPSPGARSVLNGVPVKILRAAAVPLDLSMSRPGDVLGVRGDALVVRCADDAVGVLEVVAPNRPAMSGARFGAAYERA